MDFGESIYALVEAAVKEHADDIPQSVECFLAQARRLNDWVAKRDMWERMTAQELIYRQRAQLNGKVRHPRQKVHPERSPLVRDAYANLYGYFVQGRTLGSMTGLELDAAIEEETTQGKARLRNAKMLRLCRGKVGDEETVVDAIKGADLQSIFKKAGLNGA